MCSGVSQHSTAINWYKFPWMNHQLSAATSESETRHQSWILGKNKISRIFFLLLLSKFLILFWEGRDSSSSSREESVRWKLTFDSNTEARRCCCCNNPTSKLCDDDPTATDWARLRVRTGTWGEFVGLLTCERIVLAYTLVKFNYSFFFPLLHSLLTWLCFRTLFFSLFFSLTFSHHIFLGREKFSNNFQLLRTMFGKFQNDDVNHGYLNHKALAYQCNLELIYTNFQQFNRDIKFHEFNSFPYWAQVNNLSNLNFKNSLKLGKNYLCSVFEFRKFCSFHWSR